MYSDNRRQSKHCRHHCCEGLNRSVDIEHGPLDVELASVTCITSLGSIISVVSVMSEVSESVPWVSTESRTGRKEKQVDGGLDVLRVVFIAIEEADDGIVCTEGTCWSGLPVSSKLLEEMLQ